MRFSPLPLGQQVLVDEPRAIVRIDAEDGKWEQFGDVFRASKTHLAAFDTDIGHFARIATRQILNVGIIVGPRVLAYATSMGMVLLVRFPAGRPKEVLGGCGHQPITRPRKHP